MFHNYVGSDHWDFRGRLKDNLDTNSQCIVGPHIARMMPLSSYWIFVLVLKEKSVLSLLFEDYSRIYGFFVMKYGLCSNPVLDIDDLNVRHFLLK